MSQRNLCCTFCLLFYVIIIVELLPNGNNAELIGNCNFEKDFCGYTTDSDTGNFFWSRLRSATPTHNTGPNSDHNGKKKSFYVYTESSDPAKVSNTASLTSPLINDAAPLCLQFWYHAFGEGMGNLKVYLKGQSVENKEIFRSDGNKGNHWIKKKLDIDFSGPFHIQFVSERGVSFTSDMAIDDVKFTSGICTEEPSSPGTPEPTKPPPIEPKPYVPSHIYGVERIGCYKDQGRRAFPEKYNMKRNTDPLTYVDKVKKCRDYVDSKGEDYQIFGVQYYGHECFYGSKNDPETEPFKYGAAFNCDYETVGGGWSNYVYLSCKDKKSCADEMPPTPPPPPKSFSDIKGIEKIGCYRDKPKRALPNKIYLDQGKDELTLLNNVQRCRDIAIKNKAYYFAVQYWRECFYGSKETNPFQYDEGKCPNEFTGGAWTQMVYKLSSDKNKPISLIPGRMMKKLTLQ